MIYFFGSHNHLSPAGIQYVLDEVVEELQKNPQRTFNEVKNNNPDNLRWKIMVIYKGGDRVLLALVERAE